MIWFLWMCGYVYSVIMALVAGGVFVLGVAFLFLGPSDNWFGAVLALVAVPVGVLFARLAGFCLDMA